MHPPRSTVTAASRQGRAVFRPDPDAVSRFDPNFGHKFSRPGIERLKPGGKRNLTREGWFIKFNAAMDGQYPRTGWGTHTPRADLQTLKISYRWRAR
jgi:hypothetical protein